MTATDKSPRSLTPHPAQLIAAPSRSIIWIALWVLICLVFTTLVVVIGPAKLWAQDDDYASAKGAGTILLMPLVSAFIAVITTVSAVRRRGPYRAQQASPEGQALQHESDVLVGRKHYVVLHIIGVVLAVIFGLSLAFVALIFATERVDLSTAVILVICLFVVGLPAAQTLSVALRRRAARRRINSQTGNDYDLI